MDDPVFPIEKPLPNNNPINNNDEDTGIKLVIHKMYNSEVFAVLFPDGGLLNFSVANMEELKAFESAIEFYDCPY
jgi:hypothetical protein